MKSILFFNTKIKEKDLTFLIIKAFLHFQNGKAISFSYTIFCVHALDFTTIYGIIVKHELKVGHNILCNGKIYKRNILLFSYNYRGRMGCTV